VIEASELGPLGLRIGRGATSFVYRIDYRMPFDPRALVFRELRPDNELKNNGFSAETLIRDMTNAVQMRLALGTEDRKDFDAMSAWPLDLVHSGGRTVGMVMPLIPGEYFTATHQAGQQADHKPRDLSVMVAADAWANTMGIDRSAFTDSLDRVLILASLVRAVARLHKHRIVYGDLSLKNAVFSPTSHNVLLLDCDGTASLDDPQRRQLHSPYFQPPEILNKSTRLQDTRTDVYKLALCIVRVLQTPSRSAMQASNPDILRPLLGAGAVAVLRQALDPDPDSRPTATDLLTVLTAHYDVHAPRPVVNYFYPLRTTVPSGDKVLLLWDVTNSDRHQGILHSPDGSRHRVDLEAGRAQVTINHSGRFRLEVVSPFGGAVVGRSQLVRVPGPSPEMPGAVEMGDIS
jgi:serine/threonine protein kinase